jgi:hypothetical protein
MILYKKYVHMEFHRISIENIEIPSNEIENIEILFKFDLV